MSGAADLTLGWIGAGRMGAAMASQLLDRGCALQVWNRTRAKAAPLAEKGAVLVESPHDLAGCDVVFTNLASSDVFVEVITGANGLLANAGTAPRLIVDFSTISTQASAQVRAAAAARGTALLDAPVSGNAKVVSAGKLSMVVSGRREDFDLVRPHLEMMAQSVTFAGEGEAARIVKICHNVLLGVVAQSLAEITVLAEKGGVPRHALHGFINGSVMGSMFSRYKAPAYVNLDFTPTFTPPLLRKDLDLGLAAARELGVPMPLAAQTREIVQSLIGRGYADRDFAVLLELEAQGAGLELVPENVEVDVGL